MDWQSETQLLECRFRKQCRRQALPQRTIRRIEIHVGNASSYEVSAIPSLESGVSEAKLVPSTTNAPGATQRLAQFASSLHFEQLPRDVVNKTKLSILDT